MTRRRIPLVIIGGGVQGTCISFALASRFPRSYHLVVDPHSAPLMQWERDCNACGVQYLRSPGAHHLSSDPHSLLRFQRIHRNAAHGDLGHNSAPPFISRYKRPLFSLFMHHARALIAEYRLMQFRLKATCHRIALQEKYAVVDTDQGVVHAERVLVCSGIARRPCIPHWVPANSSIPHVFSASFDIADYRRQRKIVIIGGGITALQLALSVADSPLATAHAVSSRNEGKGRTGEARREVIVLSRHQLRYADFDSDPCYVGPRCLAHFEALDDIAEKARLIDAARNTASIPPDIAERFSSACIDRRCQLIIGEVSRVRTAPRAAPDACRYRLSLTDGQQIACDAVILATGFSNRFLQVPFLRDVQQDYSLPCSPEGMPLTDQQLRWHPRLLVCGPSASLTLGPAAGNIIGAHLSLRRMLPLFQGIRYRREYAWTALKRREKGSIS